MIVADSLIVVEVEGSNLSGVFLSRLLRLHVSSSRYGMVCINNSSAEVSMGPLVEDQLDFLGVSTKSEDVD